MNQILVHSHELISNSDPQSPSPSQSLITIEDPFRMDHIKTVLKAQKGDQLKVCLVDQGIGKALVKELSPHQIVLMIDLTTFQRTPQQKSWCHLTIGLSRPPTMKKILEHATTMGAQSFHLMKATLSEKSYLQAGLYLNNDYQKYLDLGLSQSATYYQNPQVKLYTSANNHDLKTHLSKKSPNKFILDPSGTMTFLDYDQLKGDEDFYLAIGPERGWTKEEIEFFNSHDYQLVSISQSILRVEMSVFYALAQLELLKTSFPRQK